MFYRKEKEENNSKEFVAEHSNSFNDFQEKSESKEQEEAPSQSMTIPGGYDIGDNIRANKDHSQIAYGPWSISKNAESEDSIHYSMELDAKLIDDTGSISRDDLTKYKDSLKNSFENTYAKGEGEFFDKKKKKTIKIKWTGKINITVASANIAVSNRSLHVRIRDNGKVAGTTKGEGFGFAQHGYSVVYINKKILENAPATEGVFKGTGLSDSGAPTLQRTFAHEVFHTLYLFHPEDQKSDTVFGIPETRFDAFHEGKNLMAESQKEGNPNPKAGDQLIPDQMNIVYKRLELKDDEKEMKAQVKKRNNKR